VHQYFKSKFRPFLVLALTAGISLPSAAQQSDSAPPRGGVINSAPNLIGAGTAVVKPAAGQIADLVQGTTPAAPSAAALDPLAQADAPSSAELNSLLKSEEMPWPLRYRELSPMGVVYLSLPTEQEARLQLPGIALDGASRAREQVSKYITDSIGVAAQDRARQLEVASSWVERTTQMRQAVQVTDDWALYAFAEKAHEQLSAFRAKVTKQSAAELARHIADLERVVSAVSPVMNSMQSYELRTAWYAVLVQYKDGLQLVQAQQNSGDALILKTLDDFASANPRVPRPEGEVPKRTQSGDRAMPPMANPGPVVMAEPTVRAPAQAPAAVPNEEEQSGALGAIIGIVMVMGFIGFFVVRFRNRFGRKKPAA
jgi:hypothetical protein